MTSAHVVVQRRDDFVVVGLEGEVDFSNVLGVEEQVQGAPHGEDMGMVLDLTLTRYIDSAGVRMLFTTADKLETARQQFCISLPQDSPLRRIIKVTNLDAVAFVGASIEECIQLASRDIGETT